MRQFLWASFVAFAFCVASQLAEAQDAKAPIKILLITGGCCHDYAFQTKAMQMALKDRGIDADWTVFNEGGTGTRAEIDLYKNPDWSKGFDVVVHNECFADTTNPEYIRSITKAHQSGTNSVVIHCAMHTYRAAMIDDWRETLGVTSRRHDRQAQFVVTPVAKDHAIMKDFPTEWKTPMDELYVIEKIWPNTTVLATSVSFEDGKTYPVAWTSRYGKSRTFGTTFGHGNATFQDKVFLDMLVKGIQWSAGRIEDK